MSSYSQDLEINDMNCIFDVPRDSVSLSLSLGHSVIAQRLRADDAPVAEDSVALHGSFAIPKLRRPQVLKCVTSKVKV